MLVYVVLIFVYHIWMRRIERAYGLDEDSSPAAGSE